MKQEHRMTFTFDALIDQIIEGRKTATVERIEEQGYLDEWDTGLGIGYVYIVHDSQRIPRCRIRVIKLELCRWDDIPEWLWRGETNQNAEEFRVDHLDYFDHPDDGFAFIGVLFELVEVLGPSD
ncbi:MAG: ASCH domain-containing protein [Planctomycetota bacterium]